MPSDRSLLEREMQRVELRPFTLEGFHRRRQRKERNRRIGTAVVALVLATAAFGGLVRAFTSGRGTTPAEQLPNSFVGTWELFAHNSLHTLEIRVAGDGTFALELSDEAATVCDGLPATETGVGTLSSSTEMSVTSQVITCQDGTVLEDVPPATYTYDPETDTLTDNVGSVWERDGGEDPGPDPATSGGMWPQSTLEEAQRAQRLADAGDPRYTWQVLPEWPPYGPGGAPEMDPGDAEIFVRFLQEELGWDEFSWGVGPSLYPPPDWPWEFVVVRCAPGRTNPLYPNDPDGRGCAPTIDEHRYETVEISADQPVRAGDGETRPSGIWVVTRWVMLQPSDAPITGTDDLRTSPFFQRQVQQVVPPSDAEATEFLRAFLQARVDGEGAEQYLHSHAEQVVAQQACSVHTSASCAQIPLLYATTSDAPYERFEFELVEGPVWPGGWMEFKVRLFAEAGTVVEQPFFVDRGEDGRLVLLYGTLADGYVPTTENGEAVGLPYELLDGEVTFFAARPWYEFSDYGPETIALDGGTIDGSFAVLPDPLPVETGCRGGPAPADAEELARSIRSDPDLEATEPVAVGVGGIEALRMDVVAAAGASVCDYMGTPLVLRVAEPRGPLGPDLGRGRRMRLYLLDLPEGSSARILAIAISAPEPRFESVVEAAAPIVDSFEFQTG